MSAFAPRWSGFTSSRLVAEPPPAPIEWQAVPFRAQTSALGSSRSTSKRVGVLVSLLATVGLHAAIGPALPGRGLEQSFTGSHTKATLFIPGETVPRFGFVPVRVSIDNRDTRELTWNAKFTQVSYSNAGVPTESRSTLSIVVPAGRSGDRWVFVPTADTGPARGSNYGSWGSFGVALDGAGISETNLNFNVSRGNTTMGPWAVSTSLDAVVRARLIGLKTDAPQPAYRTRGAPPAPAVRPLLRNAPNLSSFDPAQSLGDWRVWSPFSRVVLRADEYVGLPPANRAALRDWVALGGCLYLVPETAGTARFEGIGAGMIATLQRPIAEADPHDSGGLFAQSTVLGLSSAIPYDLALPKEGLVKKISPPRVIGDWLVYFFVGFAILIAPVNLFAIATPRRRHWLFLTLPAISLAGVGVLVTAIYLQDGVGGEGARRALVVLLPGENQAAVFQEQVSRTGLLFGTNFPLASDTICAAIEVEEGAGLPGRTLEYHRNDNRASGDWFRGRARQGQHLRRLTPTRARVEQVGVGPDGAPIVQSSVGATLRDFCYIDAARVTWKAERLAPGTRVTLVRSSDQDTIARLMRTFGPGEGSFSFQGLVKLGVPEKGTGRFVAFADDSDLAPLPTLASIRWKDSAVLLTGVIEGAGAVSVKATP